jgi:hypothetical protein
MKPVKKRFISIPALVMVPLIGLLVALTSSGNVRATPAAKGCWYKATNMPKALRARAAVELDGLIYLIGGIEGPEANRVADVDVYNPVHDRWNHPGDGGDPPDLGYPGLPWPRAWLAAAVVSDTIYAIGGHIPLDPAEPGGPFNKTPWVQTYSPGDPSWAEAPYLNYPRDDAVAAVVDDKIYVIGGYDGSNYLSIMEVYDPYVITPTWRFTTAMPIGLAMSSVAAISPTIYVFGGLDGSGGTAHTLAYNIIDDSWSEMTDMLTAKSRAAAGIVNNSIYVIGGFHNNPLPAQGYLDQVEAYYPGSDGWDTMNWMPTRRGEVAAAVVGGKIYVFGGKRSWDSAVVSTTEVFDINCGNAPPDQPFDPNPGWGWQNRPLNSTLSWSSADPDGDDASLTYDVYFGTAPRPPFVPEPGGQSETTYDPGPLEPGTLYYWQIIATDNQGAVTSGDRWTFTTLDVASISKTASPDNLPEPGGTVDFTVVISNDATTNITVNSLVDDVHGDLAGQGDCVLPQTILEDGSYACTFSAEVTGNAGLEETDTVTATIDYVEGSIDLSASAMVTLTDALPEITVAKAADPTSVLEPGGPVQFTVAVTNTGGEELTLEALVDDVHGDLDGEGTCSVSGTIAAGATYTCSFTETVSGAPGYIEVDTVTATVRDDEDNVVQASDEAQVEVREPRAGIEVRKQAAVDKAFVGNTITYTYTVENVGDIQLTGVSASDDRLGAIGLDKGTLAPGAIATGTASYIVAASDWPRGITNTVTVTGTTPAAAEVTGTDTVVVPVGGMTFLPLVQRE